LGAAFGDGCALGGRVVRHWLGIIAANTPQFVTWRKGEPEY
jgi:hypothetical protein